MHTLLLILYPPHISPPLSLPVVMSDRGQQTLLFTLIDTLQQLQLSYVPAMLHIPAVCVCVCVCVLMLVFAWLHVSVCICRH